MPNSLRKYTLALLAATAVITFVLSSSETLVGRAFTTTSAPSRTLSSGSWMECTSAPKAASWRAAGAVTSRVVTRTVGKAARKSVRNVLVMVRPVRYSDELHEHGRECYIVWIAHL